MTKFHGIVPPIVTPLNTDGTVNYADLDHLVEHLITAGVDGLFPMGSTGQVAYLTDADRVAIVEAVCRKAAGRVPVIVGAIDLTAARVIESARALIAAGADVNLPDHGGVTPLRHAEQRGYHAIAALLRAAGAR